MKKEQKKIKEPFKPEDTPKPPQIIEPGSGGARENPVTEQSKEKKGPDNKTDEKKQRTPLLGDETEIDDETTI